MAGSVTSINKIQAPTAVQPAAQTAAKRQQPAAAKTSALSDTVKISSAARSLQQRTEAPAATVQAASSGDVQAKAQLEKPVAAESNSK